MAPRLDGLSVTKPKGLKAGGAAVEGSFLASPSAEPPVAVTAVADDLLRRVKSRGFFLGMQWMDLDGGGGRKAEGDRGGGMVAMRWLELERGSEGERERAETL